VTTTAPTISADRAPTAPAPATLSRIAGVLALAQVVIMFGAITRR
jgi:hypothetical protein